MDITAFGCYHAAPFLAKYSWLDQDY